eukprot:362082-Chlamydomonas_euryale.AAC.2
MSLGWSGGVVWRDASPPPMVALKTWGKVREGGQEMFCERPVCWSCSNIAVACRSRGSGRCLERPLACRLSVGLATGEAQRECDVRCGYGDQVPIGHHLWYACECGCVELAGQPRPHVATCEAVASELRVDNPSLATTFCGCTLSLPKRPSRPCMWRHVNSLRLGKRLPTTLQV